MSYRNEARLTSEVRAHSTRSEPIAPATNPSGQLSSPVRRTTRFRLERVSLMPFVPAPLLAYVERTRARRRVRLALMAGAAGLVSLLAGSALWFGISALRDAPESSARAAITQVRPAPSAEGAKLLEPRTVDPTGTSALPKESHVPAAAAPTVDDSRKPSRGASSSGAAGKPSSDAPRPARKRTSSAAPEWWW